jgi:hypothetical protein
MYQANPFSAPVPQARSTQHHSKLAIAAVLTLVVILVYVGVVLLAKGAWGAMQSLTAPTDALITLAELPAGFEAAPYLDMHLGFEAFAQRRFWAPDESWQGGPYAVEHTVIRMLVASGNDVDQALDSYLATSHQLGQTSGVLQREAGPILGGPTAWRRLADADEEDPADAIVVAMQRGKVIGILRVDGYRDDLTVDEVAALARPLVARLETAASR